MQRHFYFAMVCALSAAALALLLAARVLRSDVERRAPESLAEAIEVADALGLFHRHEGSALGTWCLVVSERELPCTSFQGPRMNNPRHPFWIGTVAIYDSAHAMVEGNNYDPACSVVWGSRFVYGDPNLIEILTGHRS